MKLANSNCVSKSIYEFFFSVSCDKMSCSKYFFNFRLEDSFKSATSTLISSFSGASSVCVKIGKSTKGSSGAGGS